MAKTRRQKTDVTETAEYIELMAVLRTKTDDVILIDNRSADERKVTVSTRTTWGAIMPIAGAEEVAPGQWIAYSVTVIADLHPALQSYDGSARGKRGIAIAQTVEGLALRGCRTWMDPVSAFRAALCARRPR